MSNKEKQLTAVQWLESQIDNNLLVEVPIWFWDLLNEAKAMEKEQIINSILKNQNITSQVTLKDAEQYYNETYGE